MDVQNWPLQNATFSALNGIADKLEQLAALEKQERTSALVFEQKSWGTVSQLEHINAKLAEILAFWNNEA